MKNNMTYEHTDYASKLNVAVIKPKFTINTDEAATRHNVVVVTIKGGYRVEGAFYDIIAYCNDVGNPLVTEGIDITWPQYKELLP